MSSITSHDGLLAVPAFEKPNFSYNFRVGSQLNALRAHRDTAPGRSIMPRSADQLVVASWNIANLGLHERRPKDYKLIGEIISWFDLVAIQETNNNLSGLRGLAVEVPESYRLTFSDKAGNNERMAFIYDSDRLEILEETGEIAVPPRWKHVIRVPGSAQKFNGFDRNPFLSAFRVNGSDFEFGIVNIHLYFGSESSKSHNRRFMEALATARWADLRRSDADAYTQNMLVMGDFNLKKADWGDPIWEMLGARGLFLVPHSTYVGGSNINDDRPYDQVAFFPGPLMNAVSSSGVFDFDRGVFSTLRKQRPSGEFLAYVRYYLSDHRPLWVSFGL